MMNATHTHEERRARGGGGRYFIAVVAGSGFSCVIACALAGLVIWELAIVPHVAIGGLILGAIAGTIMGMVTLAIAPRQLARAPEWVGWTVGVGTGLILVPGGFWIFTLLVELWWTSATS